MAEKEAESSWRDKARRREGLSHSAVGTLGAGLEAPALVTFNPVDQVPPALCGMRTV